MRVLIACLFIGGVLGGKEKIIRCFTSEEFFLVFYHCTACKHFMNFLRCQLRESAVAFSALRRCKDVPKLRNIQVMYP